MSGDISDVESMETLKRFLNGGASAGTAKDPYDTLRVIMEDAKNSPVVVREEQPRREVRDRLPTYGEVIVERLPNYTGPDDLDSLDLYLGSHEAISLNTAEKRFAVIPCGIRLTLPVDFEAHIRPLPDLAAKGIFIQNMVVDSRYRGEVMVVMFNLSTRYFRFEPRTRIAQMVVSKTYPTSVRLISNEAA